MTQINAYLNFNGNCRDAMNFYKECLGGELALQAVEGSPIEAQCPPAIKNQVLPCFINEGRHITDGLRYGRTRWIYQRKYDVAFTELQQRRRN